MTMSNFNHIKTYYLGTDVQDRAVPEESETIRFCIHTMSTYAPIIDKLSEAFLKAQLAYQDGYLTGPKKLCILVPLDLVGYKHKPEDAETCLEGVLWLIENFKVPTCGMVISVYTSPNHERELDSHWTLTNIWTLKETWQGKNSNYITVHLPESGSDVNWNKQNFFALFDPIKKLFTDSGYDVKFITYQNRYDEIHELLKNSKLHISYVGATYIFSSIVKTPTIGLGVNRQKNMNTFFIVDGLPFYRKDYPRNIWGLGPMQEDRVFQIVDEENMTIDNDYVHHALDTNDAAVALSYAENVLNNDYRDFEKPNDQEVTIGTEPWFYISIDNFLPESEFNKLKSEALDVPTIDGEVSRKIHGYDPTPQIETLFKTFLRAKDKYGIEIRDFKSLKKFIHYAVTPPNFTHKMHIEAPFKIMSAVLYLGPEENIGTRLYRTKDDKDPIEVEWKPNRLFVFCGHDHTFHDYASTDTRYTYNYFLVDPNVVENEDYKAGLI